jgi:hypothetical protein
MKITLTSFILLLLCAKTFAQETEERGVRINKDLIEVYNVLKDKPEIKQGPYAAKYGKKKINVATGQYQNNKQIGLWNFYDDKGRIQQTYDYDNNKITYELGARGFTYKIDADFKSQDEVTGPSRIGGKFYGYLPYLAAYRRPPGMDYNSYALPATIELLITPIGNLAEYTLHIDTYDYVKDLRVNLDLFKPEDKLFVPGKINGEGVASRIIISCNIYRDELVFLSQTVDRYSTPVIMN